MKRAERETELRILEMSSILKIFKMNKLHGIN